jgi:tRNA (guanine37-N1)-methyltransferase
VYRVGIVSLFAQLIEPVTRFGVVGRACTHGLLDVDFVSPRDFTVDRHRTVDDRPYGGGPGMVLKYEPVRDAVRALRAKLPAGSREVVLTAQGRVLDQALARELALAPGLLLVAGRYEGLDERIVAEVRDEVSLGHYVLSGGELAAAVLVDVIARLLPGVLGHEQAAEQDSYAAGLLDHPQYTRPEIADGMRVPDVLLRGDHDAVRRWRLKQALGRTWLHRPRLLAGRQLSSEERALLRQFQQEYVSAGRPEAALPVPEMRSR